jgi:predicted amidohydrolase
MVRVAVIQIDPGLAEPDSNTRAIEESMRRAADDGAQLVILPECAVSGYVYESLDEAMAVAEPIPGPSSERIVAAAARHNLYVVAGLLERDGGRCYNAALLAGPSGIEAIYRKTHTLCLGVDRFTTPGDIPFRVHDLPIGRIGILICYDLRFPEPARALALQGAQAIALPTNWPVTSFIQPDVFTRARAAENRIFVLAANRCGEERGARFLGRSQIVSPDGAVLKEAGQNQAEMLVMDIDLMSADRKHVVVRPGEHEMDFFSDRRPELYGTLVRDLSPAEVS